MSKHCLTGKAFIALPLVALFACVLSLTGCGRTDDDSLQVDTAVQYEIIEEQTALDTAQYHGLG